jgi:hypothetical protein
MTAEQYKQLVQNWDRMPVKWNPEGIYGGIKEVKAAGRGFLFAIPGLSSLLILGAVFLPWLSLNLLNNNFSTNGIGALSAPPGFVEQMQKLSQKYGSFTINTSSSTSTLSNQPYESSHGWILIVLCAVSLGLLFCGLISKSKNFVIVPLISGVVCLGLGLWDLIKTTQLVNDTYKQFNNSLQVGFIGVGPGLYLVVAGSIALIIGGIITLSFYNKTGV